MSLFQVGLVNVQYKAYGFQVAQNYPCNRYSKFCSKGPLNNFSSLSLAEKHTKLIMALTVIKTLLEAIRNCYCSITLLP